jgi:hypothetical protein
MVHAGLTISLIACAVNTAGTIPTPMQNPMGFTMPPLIRHPKKINSATIFTNQASQNNAFGLLV